MRQSYEDKVVICIPCLLVGGTEMHALALARALISGGYGVTVCAYHEHDPVMVAEFEKIGAAVRLFGLDRNPGGGNSWRMPRLLANLIKVFRQEQPQFVHVEYMTPGIAPILAAKMCRVPHLLATVHVPARHYGKKLWLPRTAARLCDVFLCVSQTAERCFFGNSALFDAALLRDGRRHFTIHNPVDLEKAKAVAGSGGGLAKRQELGLDGSPVIGVVGRLSHEKGQGWLLEAMTQVVQQVPGTKLLVVGDGSDRRLLAARAAELGLDGQIVWIGSVPPDEVPAYIGAVDVIAVPSKWEGFGLSAAEAMAAGKPVVASDVDGLQEVVADGETGLLVPCGDVAKMANALASLLEDPGRRSALGDKGRARAEAVFSKETFAERHLSLYETLLVSRGLSGWARRTSNSSVNCPRQHGDRQR